jgi:hypothetical protein
VETKLRATHAARALHDQVKGLARREGKTAVLALADKGRPGFLVCIPSDDFEAAMIESIAANPSDHPEGTIRPACARIQEHEP